MKSTTHDPKRRPRTRIPASIAPLLRSIGRIAEGEEMPVYAVGGCVRDWMLGLRGTVDLDLTVEGSGIDLGRLVTRQLGGTITVHPQFGTATVTLPEASHQHLDFATARKERYVKPAAYPRVWLGTLREDLYRRDFTINAMAIALHPGRFGTLVDPFHGARDLREKQLRVLHGRSFLDDPSRILRGIRFVERFGLEWELATARVLRAAMTAGALGWLNTGRLRRELERMSREPRPQACYRRLITLLDAAA